MRARRIESSGKNSLCRRCTQLTTFLALYRGDSISFAARLLTESQEQEQDAVLQEIERGRQRALQLVKSGAE